MKAVIDTNIIIDFLRGMDKAKEELHRYEEPHISLITWMEVVVGAKNRRQEDIIKSFLKRFMTHSVSPNVAEKAVKIRREMKLRLPDAIILATSRDLGYVLVTRNSKDFSPTLPAIRIPYEL